MFISPHYWHLPQDLGKRYGLAAADTLHVASAISQQVQEFVTAELPGIPLFRVEELEVRSLQSFELALDRFQATVGYSKTPLKIRDGAHSYGARSFHPAMHLYAKSEMARLVRYCTQVAT
jgi:hypothetical protein